jgi:hypothetical protein
LIHDKVGGFPIGKLHGTKILIESFETASTNKKIDFVCVYIYSKWLETVENIYKHAIIPSVFV